jgi:hypothetical protein
MEKSISCLLEIPKNFLTGAACCAPTVNQMIMEAGGVWAIRIYRDPYVENYKKMGGDKTKFCIGLPLG